MTLDTSGPTWREPLAHCVPEESSSRTWQVMSLWGWETFSGTLPRWGMTRRGALYELRTPELPTVEPGSSSLPTPRATRGGSGTETMYALGAERTDEGRPQGEVLLPTPVADHSRGLPSSTTDYASLPNAVCSLLPTPMARDGKGPSAWADRTPDGLPDAVALLPTPTTMDSNSSGGSTPANVTLTDAVVRTSLGARTNPRFAAGSESSDGLPLDLLSEAEWGSD